MKYKVGDKVRVRKDLKIDKWYGNCCFVEGMKDYEGKIVEIVKISEDSETCCIKGSRNYFWTDEMFEPVITNFDKVKEMMDVNDINNCINPFCVAVHKMRNETECIGRACSKCKKWLKQPYEEPKKEILDKEEKEYLSAVIKPFRGRVECIIKVGDVEIDNEFIRIILDDVDTTNLPYFEKGTMYKGMELGKEYTLKELGL